MVQEKTPGTDIIPSHWIAPGISFRNPSISKTSTNVKRIPWMMPDGWKPLSVMGEGYPNMMSQALSKDKQLGLRKPYWRRKFKNNRLRRMGHDHKEVPSFDEMGLGGSAIMSTEPAPSSERNGWGSLTSLLTTAGSIWQKTAALKIEQKAAVDRMKIQMRAEENSMVPSATTIAVIIGASIAGYVILTRR